MTKDEKYLTELYRLVEGSPERGVDPACVGSNLGYSDRQTKNILKGLMKANFVVYHNSDEVALTSRGLSLAQSLTYA
ncbi:MAG: hypothetical protein K940chlam9_01092 [Chlamydiae bacterium]|nr:hypothetical protein [Chlamydiota bacterium]